jgi:hypothetical protein
MLENNNEKYIQIKHKLDSKINWESINPILLEGELGFEYEENE